uniref:Testis expressed 47 n=1 Tax=Varanus komodoensis TaxID=61221 RepID=A0A8D2LAV0_VARKO
WLSTQKFLLHRLFYVATLREDVDPAEVTAYHEQLFQKISKFHLGEPASGILLIYSQCILHILEASSGTLYHILKDLAACECQGPEALFQGIKLLVMSHNIPTRLFPQWCATRVEVPVTLEDVTQTQTTEEVIAECLTLILRLGVYLATLKVSSKGLSECLHTAVPELLIPAETIRCLCKAQECLSPGEFLRMYNNPLQPNMDSGIFICLERNQTQSVSKMKSLLPLLEQAHGDWS